MPLTTQPTPDLADKAKAGRSRRRRGLVDDVVHSNSNNDNGRNSSNRNRRRRRPNAFLPHP